MCLGLPGRVLQPVDRERQSVRVEVSGEQRQVSAAMLLDDGADLPRPGDWVLVHMGFALAQMDESEARDILDSQDELSSMYPS